MERLRYFESFTVIIRTPKEKLLIKSGLSFSNSTAGRKPATFKSRAYKASMASNRQCSAAERRVAELGLDWSIN